MLLSKALSESSAASYRRTFASYKAFIHQYIGLNTSPLPPNVQHLTLFIAFCYEQGFSPATISTYVSALGYIFKMGNFQDISNHFVIKKLLQGVHKSRSTRDTRLPITPDILKKLILSLEETVSSFFHRTMFRAMFLLAFHAFLRVGEITSTGAKSQHYLLRKHIVLGKAANTSDTLEITFPHYKHTVNPSSILTISKNEIDQQSCPVFALTQYLSLRKHETENIPLFSFMDGVPVSRTFFTQQLQLSLKWAGLSFAVYKSHSFRIGAASFCASKGFSESQIQLMGRWRSNAFKRYIRIPMIQL